MKKAIVQICGPVWAVGDTAESCYRQMQEVDPSWTPDSLGRAYDALTDDLLLVDCSDALADLVTRKGGDIRYQIDLDWPASADVEE